MTDFESEVLRYNVFMQLALKLETMSQSSCKTASYTHHYGYIGYVLISGVQLSSF